LYLARRPQHHRFDFCRIYTRSPDRAGKGRRVATAILDIGERMQHATSMDALAALQDELETILRAR